MARGLTKVVEQHPLFEEIYELARNRYSPENKVRLLQYQHAAEFEAGELPPLPHVRTIRRWLKNRMPEKDMLPLRVLEAKLQTLDRKIDLMRSHQQLYTVAEDRVARLMGLEENLPVPLPGIDRAIETLLKIGTQVWRVGQDLGLYPRQPGAALAMGVKGPSGEAAFAVLQVGEGPPRLLDLQNLDLTNLSEPELQALRQLPTPSQGDGPGGDQREAEAGS